MNRTALKILKFCLISLTVFFIISGIMFFLHKLYLFTGTFLLAGLGCIIEIQALKRLDRYNIK